MARLAANAARVHKRMPDSMNMNIEGDRRRALCSLAQKVLDMINAAYTNPELVGFRWQIKGFFIWDSLFWILNSVATVVFYRQTELDTSWKKMAAVYSAGGNFACS
jgi:hypothetical protein